jgi:hypothetical protein
MIANHQSHIYTGDKIVQTLSISQDKAVSAISMIRNGIDAGMDGIALYEMARAALPDEAAKVALDTYMRENIKTYDIIANRDLANVDARLVDKIAKARERVIKAAAALSIARQNLDALTQDLPPTLAVANGAIIKKEFAKIATKDGAKTRTRDVMSPGKGKEMGFTYVPFAARLVASKATKEHDIRLVGRRVADLAGRWSITAWINLRDDEVLKVNIIDIDPRKAINNCYMELCQQLGERGLFTANEFSFIVNFGSADLPARYESTLTNVPRDVLGVGGTKRLSDYVELVGDDRIE